MASSRFMVLNSYLFWQNRLLIVWCALNDKQKYHPNQQISASLIVNFFVLESGESSVLEVLGIALCFHVEKSCYMYLELLHQQ